LLLQQKQLAFLLPFYRAEKERQRKKILLCFLHCLDFERGFKEKNIFCFFYVKNSGRFLKAALNETLKMQEVCFSFLREHGRIFLNNRSFE